MVVQIESEAPEEVSSVTSTQMEPAKYVIVKNHVRELPPASQEKARDESPAEAAPAAETHAKKKRKKSSKITKELPKTEDISSDISTEISASDLEELRTVYKKCKEVINRIESKYGHLLGLDGTSSSSWEKQRSSDEYEAECTCSKNKKIVFDDDGQQVLQETVLENHVCPKTLKRRHSDVERRTLDIQYEEPAALPEDLQSLGLILKDSSINKSYRHKVIKKVKSIRLDYSNNIRFDKPNLIEKLKTNPDEILDFKGTNFCDLPGYPDKK